MIIGKEIKTRGTRYQITSEDIMETIRQIKGGFRLYSKKGKNLGTFDTKAGAEKHEREIQYFKHKK